MPNRTRSVVLLPERRRRRAQPVVTAVAAAALEPQRAERQVEFVVDDDDPLDRDLEEPGGSVTTGPPDSFMNDFGLASTTGDAGQPPFDDLAAAAVRLEPAADPLGEQVDDEEADVVPGRGVARPGIAEADDQIPVVGHGSRRAVPLLVRVAGLGLRVAGLAAARRRRLAAVGRRGCVLDDAELLGGLGHLGLDLLPRSAPR